MDFKLEVLVSAASASIRRWENLFPPFLLPKTAFGRQATAIEELLLCGLGTKKKDYGPRGAALDDVIGCLRGHIVGVDGARHVRPRCRGLCGRSGPPAGQKGEEEGQRGAEKALKGLKSEGERSLGDLQEVAAGEEGRRTGCWWALHGERLL